MVPDKPQKVENFHFTWCGYIGFRNRWYVKDSHMQKYVNLPSKIIITHYCRRVVDILCLEFWRSLAIGSNDMQVCESKKKTGNFYLFFICFDAKMSFMFLLAYCHDLGCGSFVPSIMITTQCFYTIVKLLGLFRS